ncbi:MAG: hypothetical protein ACO23R_17400 [bacterium]
MKTTDLKRKIKQRDIAVKGKVANIDDERTAAAWAQGKASGLTDRQTSEMTGIPTGAIRKMNRKYAEEIEVQVRANLGAVAVSALKNMVDLAFKAENEHVRFVATKDLLDRAGFAPKKEVDIKQEIIRRDPQEIEAEARKKLGDELAEKLLGLAGKPDVVDAEFELEEKQEEGEEDVGSRQ